MDHRPIGVFDSGLGGLTAVRELRRLLLGEIRQEEKYRPLLTHPVFAAALARLEESL